MFDIEFKKWNNLLQLGFWMLLKQFKIDYKNDNNKKLSSCPEPSFLPVSSGSPNTHLIFILSYWPAPITYIL